MSFGPDAFGDLAPHPAAGPGAVNENEVCHGAGPSTLL
jgi:hypothetical protein